MKAVLLNDNEKVDVGSKLELSDSRAKHLIKVTRTRMGENILLLDGRGKRYISEVSVLERNSLTLSIISCEEVERMHNIDILLAPPKREAFELTLKNCVELGIGTIHLFDSDFGQWKIKNDDRTESIIDSAMIQSNNSYRTVINKTNKPLSKLEEVFIQYDEVILATLKKKLTSTELDVDSSKKYLIVLGPEGGLSEEEETFLLELDKTRAVRLHTPILRTPNAASALTGYVLGKFAGL